MFEMLEIRLDTWVSMERKKAIIDALTVLSDYGFMAAWTELSAYLECTFEDSLTDIIDTVETIISTGLDRVLNEHSIQMDGSYVLRTAVLRGLKVLSNYADTQTVLSLTMESDNAIESLCDLLELTTEYKYIDYVDYIYDVSPALIKLINKNASIEEDNESVTEIDDLDPTRKKLLLSYLDYYKDTVVHREINDNLFPPGVMDISFIIENHKRSLLSYEPEAADRAAIELLGISLLSSNDIANVLKHCKSQLDIVFTDIKFIGKVDMELTNAYNKVFSHGQT